MTSKLKTAIKRKHRVYRKFIKRGRKQEDWDTVQNNTRKIAEAKNQHFSKLGKKLCDPHMDIKSYWHVFSNILPLQQNCLFISNLLAKAN